MLNVYLIGICGVAMSALAAMFKEKGHKVSGSDTGFYPPISDFLQRHKILTKTGFNLENITKDIDLVIVGNVCRKDNPEVLRANELNIRYLSLPDALRDYFIEERESVVVAGTHGKSTITTLLAWILQIAGENPSFMVGGIPNNFNNNFQIHNSKHFVIEGDEYDSAYFQKDPKFLHYKPNHAIISAIEFDHFDIYPDLDKYMNAFDNLIHILPKEANLILNYDFKNIIKLMSKFPTKNYEYYSILNSKATWVGKNIKHEFSKTTFEVFYKDKLFDKYETVLNGDFNVGNLIAGIAMAHNLDVNKDKLREAILTFRGLKRRQEYIGDLNGAKIIEDFAHHPTAVKVVLEAFRKVARDNRIIAVFEPRSATARRKIFEKEFEDAFSLADVVILATPPDRGDIPKDQLFNSQLVCNNLNSRGISAVNIPEVDEIVNFLKDNAKKDDIIIIMSNGGFGGIYKKLLS